MPTERWNYGRILLSAGIVFSLSSGPLRAQVKEQSLTYDNVGGKFVFTNVMDNPPLLLRTTAPVVTAAGTGPAAPILSLVHSISSTHGIDPDLIVAVMRTESNFNRWAVSSKGALGLMQLIPATGRRFGVSDFFDPRQNIEGGVRYMKFLLDKFDWNLELSLAAYNAGENLVQRLGRIPPIRETQDYVRKIRTLYGKPTALRTSVAETTTASAAPLPTIFRAVDENGVTHFSNIEPPN